MTIGREPLKSSDDVLSSQTHTHTNTHTHSLTQSLTHSLARTHARTHTYRKRVRMREKDLFTVNPRNEPQYYG